MISVGLLTLLPVYAQTPADVLYQQSLKPLRIGRQTYESPRDVMIGHHPVMMYLRENLPGYRAELKLYRTYERVLEELQAGNLEVAWLGTVFYCRIPREKLPGKPLVSPIWRGKDSYEGQFLVRADSSIASVEDLRGKKVAFVSRDSSSGYLFPMSILNRHGIQEQDLGQIDFLDKHDSVAWAVFMQQFDAGACFAGILESSAFQSKQDQFRVLAKTGPIPNEPLVLRKGLADELGERLVELLVSEEANHVIQNIRALTGFHRTTDAAYEPVRRMLGL